MAEDDEARYQESYYNRLIREDDKRKIQDKIDEYKDYEFPALAMMAEILLKLDKK